MTRTPKTSLPPFGHTFFITVLSADSKLHLDAARPLQNAPFRALGGLQAFAQSYNGLAKAEGGSEIVTEVILRRYVYQIVASESHVPKGHTGRISVLSPDGWDHISKCEHVLSSNEKHFDHYLALNP